jgi:hypothetical protein
MCQPLYQKVGLIIKLGPQQRPHQDYEAVALLKEIERHDFLVFALAGCRADANQPHFFRRANYFFGGQQEITSLISNIRSKTYDFYNQSRFLDNVVKWFDTGDGDDRGFSEWRQIEYFLLEYENFLREVAGEPAIVLKKHPFERVYPKSVERDESWSSAFDAIYSAEKCRKLCNSIGNLVLLSRPRKLQELQYSSFALKKRHLLARTQGEEAGYFNGSLSEREVASFEAWTHSIILERGVKMLGFMSERWNIPLAEDFRKTLTKVDFAIETPP